MDVYLYSYSGNTNVINKQLPQENVMSGVLRERNNVLSPSIIIRVPTTEQFAYNYCYVPEFKRFYFIDEIVYVSAEKIEMRLKVDVLKSYEREIMEATATSAVNDNPEPFISTRKNVYNMKPIFKKVSFPQSGLFDENGSIIMITIKGDK